MLTQVRRKASRAAQEFQAVRATSGSRAAAAAVGRRAATAARWYAGQVEGWSFDRRHGVRTRAAVVFSRNALGARHADSHYYEATPARELPRVLRSLPLDPAATTFVDLGCGRGRALFQAALMGFRRVVGVELSSELAADALANVRSFRHPERALVEVVPVDAATYDLPSGPLVVYLYNPFGPETLAAVAAGIDASLRREPRPLAVVYLHARFPGPFEELPSLRSLHNDGWCAVYGSEELVARC